MTPARVSLVRVLNPNVPRTRAIRESDYVLVPRLQTYGTFPIPDIVGPETVAALAVLANWMERSERAHKASKKRGKPTATVQAGRTYPTSVQEDWWPL